MAQQKRLYYTEDFYIEESTIKTPMSYMHYHNSYELYYVIDGCRDYFIGNQFFRATDGDFIFVPKNILHRTDGKGATRILLYFSDLFLLNYFSQDIVNFVLTSFQPCVYHPSPEDSKHFHTIIKTLLNEFNTQKNIKKHKDSTMIAAYLYELLFGFTFKKNTYSSNNFSDERISLIVDYINENYKKIDNIEEIAENFFISKYHLCRIFNKVLGISLVTYINMVKIRAACELMQKGSKNMVEIGLACGFNSSAYFCNVFKREMGISPREYRIQLKKEASHNLQDSNSNSNSTNSNN